MKKLAAGFSALLLVLCVAALLPACGTASAGGFTSSGGPVIENPDPGYERTPPPVLMPEYVGELQQGYDDGAGRSAWVDVTNAPMGYITVKCNAPTPGLVRIIKGQEGAGPADDYPMQVDGSLNTFPLARGDGLYTFIVYLSLEQETADGVPLYDRFVTVQAEVVLNDEFGPFLVPNAIVNYTPTSRCVSKSYEIAAQCKTDLEVVSVVYDWVARNIGYDTDKALQVRSNTQMYVPDPDTTLRTGTGICYDYASLAAAMLRANGIPTVLVKGDVNTGEGGFAYHAWNLVWLEETGWIAVELAVNPNDWTRIDTTFHAATVRGDAGSMSRFIGDGSNYTDISWH